MGTSCEIKTGPSCGCVISLLNKTINTLAKSGNASASINYELAEQNTNRDIIQSGMRRKTETEREILEILR